MNYCYYHDNNILQLCNSEDADKAVSLSIKKSIEGYWVISLINGVEYISIGDWNIDFSKAILSVFIDELNYDTIAFTASEKGEDRTLEIIKIGGRFQNEREIATAIVKAIEVLETPGVWDGYETNLNESCSLILAIPEYNTKIRII